MNIIIEGSDAVFKTTVANKLSERLNKNIVHGSSFELSQSTNEELFGHFTRFAKATNTIYDRLIYSNLVYASMFTDYSVLSDEQRHQIEDKMKDNSILIYLYASEDTIVQRLKRRGDDYINETHIKEILERYEKAMEDAEANGMKVLKFNTGDLPSDEVVEIVLENLNQEEV